MNERARIEKSIPQLDDIKEALLKEMWNSLPSDKQPNTRVGGKSLESKNQ